MGTQWLEALLQHESSFCPSDGNNVYSKKPYLLTVERIGFLMCLLTHLQPHGITHNYIRTQYNWKKKELDNKCISLIHHDLLQEIPANTLWSSERKLIFQLESNLVYDTFVQKYHDSLHRVLPVGQSVLQVGRMFRTLKLMTYEEDPDGFWATTLSRIN